MFLYFTLLALCCLHFVNSEIVGKSPTAATCKVGQEWVEDFIKFKCYQMNQWGITKGVRGVGCVPDNTAGGKTILNGSTWTDDHFTYFCNRTRNIQGAIFTFKPINCIDGEKKVMKPGETHTMKDGTKYKCFYDNKNIVHLEVDGSEMGCMYNDILYKEKSAWLHYRPMEVEIKPGQKLALGVGSAVACEKLGEGKFEFSEYACITSESKRIHPDGYGTVSGHVVKCVHNADGTLKLELANEDTVACKVDGKRIVAGTEWDNKEKTERLMCNYGKVVKIGCLINKTKFVRVHEFEYFNEIGYQCDEAIDTGIINFGGLKGCTLANGTTIEFFQEFVTENMVMLCRHRVDNGVVSAFLQQIYCRYHGEKVQLAQTVAIGKDIVICELKDREYIVRKLSTIEMSAWKEKMNKAGLIYVNIEANDGEGQGHYIKESTTKKPATTPAALKECKDSLDSSICSQLKPICTTTPGNHDDIVKKIDAELKKPKVDTAKLNSLIHELDEASDSTDLSTTITSLFGLPGGQCACPKKNSGKSCDHCRNTRSALSHFVEGLCAKTCNTCGKASGLTELVTAALQHHKDGCH